MFLSPPFSLAIVCRYFLGALWCCAAFAAGADGLVIGVEDVVAPNFSMRGIRLTWAGSGAMEVNIAALQAQQRTFKNVRLGCARLVWQGQEVSCRNGSLDLLPKVRFDVVYHLAQRRAKVVLTAENQERWVLAGSFKNGAWELDAQWENALLTRIAPWLPKTMPTLTAGKVSGTFSASGRATDWDDAQLDVRFADLAFSDASGLHAGEKLAGTVKLGATRADTAWQCDLVWQQGEAFWQPLYLSASKGYQFRATGGFDGATLRVTDALAVLPEVGQVQFSGGWDVAKRALVEGAVRGDNLALEKLFSLYALPFLDKSALAEATVAGHADVAWQYRNGATQLVGLNLRDGGIVDGQKRFKLEKINSQVNWLADTPSVATLSFESGAVLGMPLGAVAWEMQMNGQQFNVAQAKLPILDGELVVNDFELHHDDDWHWHFAGGITPISMEKLSVMLGMPKMLGALSGMIPKVSYEDGQIEVDGALLFKVFDGTVVASQLKFSEPFGRAPRLSGNLNMRRLDLDLLTRTFSFGNVQGLIDVDVNGLVMQNWQALQFDARIASSEGSYRKKISQKAVQNISSLGGSGAVAAIQRGVVGIFENFGYTQISWTCALRNDVCVMGGVAKPTGGAYTIIAGGGIPAINVIGYNQYVSWRELITRLKRVVQENRQIIVVK